MMPTISFSGLFEFEMFLISPKGKIRKLSEDEEMEYCYEPELGDAIYDYVEKYLEEAGATKVSFQVETCDNNGGPLIDYCFDLETDSTTSPMYDLSLEDISVPAKGKKGWRLAVSPGGVRDEEAEEAPPEVDEVAESGFTKEAMMEAKEKFELYPPFVKAIERLPSVKAHVDSVTGKTVGAGGYGDVFSVTMDEKHFGAVIIGHWDSQKNTVSEKVNRGQELVKKLKEIKENKGS